MDSTKDTSPPTPETQAINDSWLQWIAENRLRGCTPESMVQTMVAAGLDRTQCEQAIPLLDQDPVFLAARRHQQLLRKLESVVANQQRLLELAPGYQQVQKRAGRSPDEFI